MILNDLQRSIIVEFSYIAEITASQLFRNYRGPLLIQFDEFISIGNEALTDAVLKYDSTRGASPKTYLFYKVRYLIRDQLRLNQLLSRHYMRYYANLKIAKEILWDKLNREPHDEEIAVPVQILIVSIPKLKQYRF